MSVFLVTWNLNKEGSAYNVARQRLIDKLNEYPNVHDSRLDTVWFVESGSAASAVSADIRTKLDDNDRLFVTQLHKGYHAGWISKTVWNWINARL